MRVKASGSLGWIASLAAALILMGCASTGEKGRLEQFEKTSRLYERAIRWSDFQSAYALTKPDPAQRPDFQRLGRIRVTSYEPLGAFPDAEAREIRQTVAIEYVFVNAMRVQRLTDQQVWVYEEASERWRLTTGLPSF